MELRCRLGFHKWNYDGKNNRACLLCPKKQGLSKEDLEFGYKIWVDPEFVEIVRDKSKWPN